MFIDGNLEPEFLNYERFISFILTVFLNRVLTVEGITSFSQAVQCARMYRIRHRIH